MSFKAYYFESERGLQRELSPNEIRSALESKKGLLWVDVEETSQEDVDFLEDTFSFHQFTLEDCLSKEIRSPKVEDFDDYLFVVVHGIDYTSVSEIVETTELDLFLGPNYVVSNHSVPLLAVASIRLRVEQDSRPLQRGADFLAYTLIDATVSNVLPTIDRMSEVADEVEDEALRRPGQSTLEAILKLKRSSLRIHRVMTPQRELMNRLSRREFPIIRTESEVFYRHAYDRVVRIGDLNQSIGDRADNALATYLSSVAIRQNETMKSLAIVASVFLPLSLLAGIYGMNFENMPELGWSWGYYAILGVMAGAVAATLSWFWARQWISWGRRQVTRVRLFAVEPEKVIGPLAKVAKWPRQ